MIDPSRQRAVLFWSLWMWRNTYGPKADPERMQRHHEECTGLELELTERSLRESGALGLEEQRE